MKKFFRVAVEGDIADHRDIVITREWIEQMATSYDPALRGARINLEHINGIDPDGMFKAYGDVTALKAEEVEIGGEKMLALYAEIYPTEELVTLSKKRQKVYTSIEVDPKFKKTSGAYLMGLAITDTPAALGVEMLKFSASQGDNSPLAGRKQSPENCIIQANEIELSFQSEAGDEPSFISKFSSRVTEIFSGLKKATDNKTGDLEAALELFATEFEKFASALPEDQSTAIADLKAELESMQEKFTAQGEELKEISEAMEGLERFKRRPPASGGDGEEKADY
ncbi:MAG: GPO family capsid scaffolding protein [Pseudomonadota bacterium]|nr:GPO family capsid scaffolding protein [Pseudomonadota bacterium]